MSNRIIKHSSRYKGPAGDSRPAAEIFAGIEARAQQAAQSRDKLIETMDDIKHNATLSSYEGRMDIIKDTVINWLIENSPEFRELVEGGG